MAAFSALALLAWTTLADEKLRLVTLAVLAMFAVKTLLFRKRIEGSSEEESRVNVAEFRKPM